MDERSFTASVCPQNADLDHVLSPAQNQEFTDATNMALSNAQPRPATPYYSAFSTTFDDCVEMVLSGGPPSPQGFADAINAALDGKGTYPACRV